MFPSSFVRPAVCFCVVMLLFSSCHKAYDVESYIGEYTFMTVGEFTTNELAVNEDGSTVPTGEHKRFTIETATGTAKIFENPDVSINDVTILVTYDDGKSVIIEALVNEANWLEFKQYTRPLTVYDETGENIVYQGNMEFDGQGKILDGTLSINLDFSAIFDIGDLKYVRSSSKIRSIAEKK